MSTLTESTPMARRMKCDPTLVLAVACIVLGALIITVLFILLVMT
jgi:hypothetical protein